MTGYTSSSLTDKDFASILQLLQKAIAPHTKEQQAPIWYFTQPSVPRRKPVGELQQTARSMGINGEAYNSVSEAYHAALHAANRNDLILITGSIFLVADALAMFPLK